MAMPCDRSLVPRRAGVAAIRKRTRLFRSSRAKPCSTSTASLKPSSAFLWFSSTVLSSELVLRQQGVARRALASADPYIASAGLQLGALLLPMLVAAKASSSGIRPFNLHLLSTIFWASSGSLLMVGLTSLLGPEETSRLAQGPTWEVFEGPEERFQAPANVIGWLESMSGGVVVPAVVHEVVFRGFFLNALRRGLLQGSEGGYAAQNGLAVLVSAVAFSSCHLPPSFLSFLALFSLGSAAGVVAIRSESVWGAVLVHGGWNLAEEAMALSKSFGLDFEVPITAGGAMCALGVLSAFFVSPPTSDRGESSFIHAGHSNNSNKE